MEKSGVALGILSALVGVGVSGPADGQELGTVLREQRVAGSTGGFLGAIDNEDHFGHALAALGDVDGDGVGDIAVGAPDDDDGGSGRGAVWILFANADGTIRSQQKISDLAGNFQGALSNFDRFGIAVAGIGDLDGDGIGELAVGAEQDDDGGTDRGAVWILFLGAEGTVRSELKISQTMGGFAGVLRNDDAFGRAIVALEDQDGDGVGEIAVGAPQDDDGGPNRGAVWILYLAADGSVRAQRKVSFLAGGFAGALDNDDRFGMSLAALGDLGGDGTTELAIGADQDDDGASAAGAVWIVSLEAGGTVVTRSKISATSGLALGGFDRLGSSLAAVGDIDGDGVTDLATGATGDDDGGINRGAVWLCFLTANAGLASWSKISATEGNLLGPLESNGMFGVALASLLDHDGDGMLDLAVGAELDDGGGTNRGAYWMLFLETAALPSVIVHNGKGINPVLLSAEEAPRIGQDWLTQVDCTGRSGRFLRAGGIVLEIVVDQPGDGRVFRYGQRLIDWRQPWIFWRLVRHHGAVVTLTHAIPNDQSLVGKALHAQAFITGRGRPSLTNALEAPIRR